MAFNQTQLCLEVRKRIIIVYLDSLRFKEKDTCSEKEKKEEIFIPDRQ